MNERSIFLDALELTDPEQRRKYLDQACGVDQELRGQVEQLLVSHNDASSFLEKPPEGLVATIAAGVDEKVGESLGGDSLEFLDPTDKPGCLGTLSQYEVVEVVGRGGMGIVLRAYDTKLNRVVAIKVMAPELAANAMAVKRFLREARAAAAVSHDHVVTIHAIEENNRPPFIVMEFVDGQSLQEKIDREGALELNEILRIGLQISRGLEAAHEQGLVHRDIKPANILLENGVERVKLTDFGLARAVDDVSVTQTGQIAGTPQFMSPEQAQGHAIDSRSDLFSLGSVLYTMCTGRPPFRGDSAVAMLRRVTDDEPRSICEVNSATPDWLEAIIFKLLAKDPADRLQSAEEVADLLSQHLAHLQHPTTASKPPHVVYRRSKEQRFDLDEEFGFIETTLRIYAWIALIWAVPALVFGMVVNVIPGNFEATFFHVNAPGALVTGVLSLIVSSLAFTGLSHVRRRDRYRIAMLGNVAALFPVNPFLVMAIPWSICSLIKLRNPKLRAAFFPVTLVTRSWPKVEVGLAIAGCLVLFLAGVVIYVTTDYGTIHIGVNDPNTTVMLDGYKGVSFENTTGRGTLRVRAGEHRLHIKQGDVEFETDTFRVRPGEAVLLSVELIDGKLGARLKTGETRRVDGASVRYHKDRVIGLHRSGRRNQQFAIQANDGSYLRFGGDNKPVLTDGKDLGPSATFTFEWQNAERTATYLRTPNDLYLRGVLDRRGHLPAMDEHGNSELFEVEWLNRQSRTLSLRTRDGVYVSTNADGSYLTTSRHRGEQEAFTLIAVPGRPPVTDVRVVATDDGWFDLLSIAEVDRDETGAEWRREGSDLVLVWGELAGLRFLADAGPRYELRSRFYRREDGGAVKFWLPVPGGHACLSFNDWDAYHGLQHFNGELLHERKSGPAMAKGDKFTVDEFHEMTARVQQNGDDVRIAVWLDGAELFNWAGPSRSVAHQKFNSPRGIGLGCGLTPGIVWETLEVRTLATYVTEVRRFEGHTDFIDGVAFSADGSLLLTGSNDKTVRLWDVATGEERMTLNADEVINSVALSPTGHIAAAGLESGRIVIWDLADGSQLRRIAAHEKPSGGTVARVMSLEFSSDGKRLLSGGDDGSVRTWDVENGEQLQRFEGTGSPVQTVTWSFDGSKILAAEYAGVFSLWDMKSGKLLQRNGKATDKHVAFAPDGRRIVSGLKVFDSTSGEVVTQLQTDQPIELTGIQFTTDGRFVVAGVRDASLRVWDAMTGREVARVDNDHRVTQKIDVSPDGRHVASGGGVRWDNNAGELVRDGDYALRLWRLPESLWPKNDSQATVFPIPTKPHLEVDALVQQFQSADVAKRVDIVRSLQSLGRESDAARVAALRALLDIVRNSTDETVVKDAFHAVEEVGEEGDIAAWVTVPAMVAYMNDNNNPLARRILSARVIGNIGEQRPHLEVVESSIAALIAKLDSRESDLVEMALWSLGQIGEKSPYLARPAIPAISRIATTHELDATRIRASAVLREIEAADKEVSATQESDREFIQGTWNCMSAITSGKELPNEQSAGRSWAFAGETFFEPAIQRPRRGKFVLDTATDPKQIDLHIPAERDGFVLIRGIYELKGDRLTICIQEDFTAVKRPTDFTTVAGDNRSLLVFQRATDRELLQGTWQVVALKGAGQTAPDSSFSEKRFLFEGVRLSLTGMPEDLHPFRLNAESTPKQIDIGSGVEVQFSKAIYELEGDTLRLCLSQQTRLDRPKDFDTEGTRYFCFTLKRVEQ